MAQSRSSNDSLRRLLFRLHDSRGRLLLHVAVWSLPVAGFVIIALLMAGNTYLDVSARTGVVQIDFAHGRPLVWQLEGARLLECADLLSPKSGPANEHVLKPIEAIELNASDPKLSAVSHGLQVAVAIDDKDLVILLRPLNAAGVAQLPSPRGCQGAGSRWAVLDDGNGGQRELQLPAQLRLASIELGEGLSLEFRGRARVGSDVTSGRQPLLTGGQLSLRRVRAQWLQFLGASPYFEVDGRELGMGDKLSLGAATGVGTNWDVPQGFLRVERGGRPSPELSVHVTSLAAQAQLVRPFSEAETPGVNAFKLLLRDDLVHLALSALVAIFGVAVSLHQLLPIWVAHVRRNRVSRAQRVRRRSR